MANITYRTPTQVAPSATTTKNAALTYEEMDGNWKSLDVDIQAAKQKAEYTNRVLTGLSGTNVLVANSDPASTAYTTGHVYYFVAVNDNTGAVTININGLGAKSITKSGSTALAAMDIRAGQSYSIFYDGTRFQLSGGVSQASGGGVIYENNTTVTSSYTLTAGKNGMSAGPLTINDGVVVTVPEGSTWTIV